MADLLDLQREIAARAAAFKKFLARCRNAHSSRLNGMQGGIDRPAAVMINSNPKGHPNTMKYMLVFVETAEDLAKRDSAEAPAYWESWSAYVQAVEQAGIVVSGAGLMPPAMATTVKIRDGKRHVQDGPYSDAKEQLGGFYVIDVPDLDTALDWAAKCPAAAYASVEVRPVMQMGE
jgi:hypothetical protein